MNDLKDYAYLNELYQKKKYRKFIYSKLKNKEAKYISYLSSFSKKKYEIVIAKYNEDISWSEPYKHLTTVYNKSDVYYPDSIKLSNLGRESQTYLYHIISNWDNLAEKTLFTQGELSVEHKPYPIPVYFFYNLHYVSNIKEIGIHFRDGTGNHLRHQSKWLQEYKDKKMKSSIINFNDFWSIFSEEKNPNFSSTLWSHGAIFSVSKQLIKQNSLDLYIYLYKIVSNHINPEEGHYLERSWYYIFNCGKIKKKEKTEEKHNFKNQKSSSISNISS